MPLLGAMLSYGTFNPRVRALVLAVAGLSKLAFIALAHVSGAEYLGQQVGISITVDLVMVVLFILYLIGAHRDST